MPEDVASADAMAMPQEDGDAAEGMAMVATVASRLLSCSRALCTGLVTAATGWISKAMQAWKLPARC